MATFIISRFSSSLLNRKIPFESLSKTSPDYNMLKFFRCLYVINANPHKDKFDPAHSNVSLLSINQVKRDTKFIISTIINFMYQGILFFKNLFSLS